LTEKATPVEFTAAVLYIPNPHKGLTLSKAGENIMGETTLIATGAKLTREDLALVPTPIGTATHKPIPHVEVVQALTETLGFRQEAIAGYNMPERGTRR
jgi:hypothetical protein